MSKVGVYVTIHDVRNLCADMKDNNLLEFIDNKLGVTVIEMLRAV